MSEGCVFDCVHPLWGGSGICYISDTGNSLCACDAGYAPRDSRGNASCVPKRVLVTVYLLVGTASLLAAALTTWNIYRYRHLPVRIQSARKTSTRLWAAISTSIYLLGFVPIGFVLAMRAGDGGYSDPAILLFNYVVLTPSVMFGVAMIANYWVECLPSQLLSPGSLAGRLKHASEASSAFVLLGLANGAPILTLGILTVYFEDWPLVAADLGIGAGTMCAGLVIVFVATQTSGVITQAMAKGSASSRAFYAKARKNLRLQAVTLSSIALVAVTITAVKQLTLAGRSTPIVWWTAQILCAHAGIVVFFLATRFEAAPAASSSPATSALFEPQGTQGTGITTVAAIFDATAAAHTLVREKRRRLTQLARAAWFDKKRELAPSNWTNDSKDTEESDPTPIDVISESTSSVSGGAWYSLNAGGAARILPIHEGIAKCDAEAGVCSSGEDEWTVESISGV